MIKKSFIYRLRHTKFFRQLRNTSYIDAILDNDTLDGFIMYSHTYFKKGKTVPVLESLIRSITDINYVENFTSGKNKKNLKSYKELVQALNERKSSYTIKYSIKNKDTGKIEYYVKDIAITYSTKESHMKKTVASNPVYETLKKCKFADYELEAQAKHASQDLPYISDTANKKITFTTIKQLYDWLRYYYPQDYPILDTKFTKCESEPRYYENGISFCNFSDYTLDRYSFYSYRSTQDRYQALVGSMFKYIYSERERPSDKADKVALRFAQEAVGMFFVNLNNGIYCLKDLTADTLWYIISYIIYNGELLCKDKDTVFDFELNYYIYNKIKKLFIKIENNNTDLDFLKSYISLVDTTRTIFPEKHTLIRKERVDEYYDGIDVVKEVRKPLKSVVLFDGTVEDPNLEIKAYRNEWKKNRGIERKERKSTERIEVLKDKVFELRKSGISLKNIAKELHINFRTVNRILNSN